MYINHTGNLYHGLSPTSHQPRSCVTPNFPKMVSDTQICHFFRINFDLKQLKLCYKVSLSENFQRKAQSCSAIKYLSNRINILAGDDLVPVKSSFCLPLCARPLTKTSLCLGQKAPTPNRKHARFTFYTSRARTYTILQYVI